MEYLLEIKATLQSQKRAIEEILQDARIRLIVLEAKKEKTNYKFGMIEQQKEQIKDFESRLKAIDCLCKSVEDTFIRAEEELGEKIVVLA